MSEGLKNTTTAFDSILRRDRLPRFIGNDKILRKYDSREALGLKLICFNRSWLKSVASGRFFDENYICHLEIRMEDLAVIVTEQRVIMIRIRSLRTEWDCQFNGIKLYNLDIQNIRCEKGGISLIEKNRQGARPKMIPCSEESSQEWLQKKLEDAFGNYIKWLDIPDQ
jgi:vacuolar protein sorting-associated protein 13A/C